MRSRPREAWGWGVVCQQRMYRGRRHQHDSHINFLELKTVFIALKLFQHVCKGKVVLFMVDNSTAVSYINRLWALSCKSWWWS